MALTADVHKERYGSSDDAPYNIPMGASVTVYRGSIALTNGVGLAGAGYLKNASSPASTDQCWGIIDQCGPESVDSGAGITNGTTSGATTVDVQTGTFFLASSTGADALPAVATGATVYVYNETTVALTSGGGTRPVAGVHVYTESAGRVQAPGNYAIKMASPTGGLMGGP
jgi:hypothetical protein